MHAQTATVHSFIHNHETTPFSVVYSTHYTLTSHALLYKHINTHNRRYTSYNSATTIILKDVLNKINVNISVLLHRIHGALFRDIDTVQELSDIFSFHQHSLMNQGSCKRRGVQCRVHHGNAVYLPHHRQMIIHILLDIHHYIILHSAHIEQLDV